VTLARSGSGPRRPLLRWHGGKWLLAPWIISLMPAHRIYVEPYGGAGSVLLRKARTYAEVWNDLDGDLVNLFRVVRERGEELVRVLELTPFAREEFDAAHVASEEPLERARQTVIRAFMGFGSNAVVIRSGFRANSNKSGTTPAHDWCGYPNALKVVVERLRGVILENREAAEVMATHDSPETLHYVDPPYVHTTRMMGTGTAQCGYRHEMSDEQHRELAAVLHSLKGMVLLSGYQCPLYEELYGDWRKATKSALADGARKRTEVVWLNPAARSESGRLL
jgi:DNA adenine methylase